MRSDPSRIDCELRPNDVRKTKKVIVETVAVLLNFTNDKHTQYRIQAVYAMVFLFLCCFLCFCVLVFGFKPSTFYTLGAFTGSDCQSFAACG